MKKLFVSLAMASAMITPSFAQWEGDPSIGNRVNPDNQTNYGYDIETTDKGTTYLYTTVPTEDQYVQEMRLQVIDPNGNMLLPVEGYLISAKKNKSFTVVGDNLLVDNKDNSALVAVSDQRTGADGYTMYKFNDKGEKLWETTIDNSTTLDGLAFMHMVACEDGGYMLAYLTYNTGTNDQFIVVNKLNNDGSLAWDEPVFIKSDSEIFSYPYLVDAGSSQAMLVYAKGGNQDLYARLIDFDGSSVWGEDILVYRGGFAPAIPLHVMMNAGQAPDGGVSVTWMGVDKSTGTYENMFSVINNDGTYAFSTGETGTNISNATEYARCYPDFIYNKEEKAFYMTFHVFEPVYQKLVGIFMQKMSLEGELLWGANGIAVEPIDDVNTLAWPVIRDAGNGNFAIFYLYQNNTSVLNPVYARMHIYDKDGNKLESSDNIATRECVKNGLYVSPLLDNNHYIISYSEDLLGSENENIYLQWVGIDGGISTGINNASSEVKVGSAGKTEYYSPAGMRLNEPAKA